MFKRPWPLLLSIGMVIALGLLTVTLAQPPHPHQNPTGKPGFKPQPGNKHLNEIIQEFPTNDRMRTAWKVRWMTTRGYGLVIQDAWFKKSPREDWMQILGDCRLGEAFVPYHRGSPRFWDVSYNFGLHTMTAADAGPHGKLLSDRPGGEPTVVMELRDRGIMYKDTRAGVRRGQVMVLWAALNAANYVYVMEYGFRDDGGVTFRIGSTGHNYSGSETIGHMHNGMFRIDVNLDGKDNNTVELVEHIEPHPNGNKKMAMTKVTPFNNGFEGGADFQAEKFTMVRIRHTQKKNARGEYLSYDLVSARMGNARHFGGGRPEQSEECSEHDFWVTKNRPGELYYGAVKHYARRGENIRDTDVVVWYNAPGHHEPRSEDGEFRGGVFNGVTPIMWCGFELKPRNIWDRTPFHDK